MTAQRLLWLFNIGLALALAWLWVDESGQPRPQNWVAPAPLVPGATATADAPTAVTAPNPSQYMATLDRPIFAPDRRPPPPPDTVPATPPPDPLADFTLYGVYGSDEKGGILAKSDGRVRRIRTGESLGDWIVRSVQGRQVTLVRADETRTMFLAHVYGVRPKQPSPPRVTAAPGVPLDRQSIQQQAMEDARERLRQNNEIRRRAGLPALND